MRKIILFSTALLLLFFVSKINFVNAQLTNSACLGISGKFTAQNWSGGTVDVGCDGDAGNNCPGQIKSVSPNTSFTLTKCSCLPYADGCLKVAKKLKFVTNSAGRPRVVRVGDRFPNACTISSISNICGTNGNIITGNFKISCNVPTSTPTNMSTPSPRPSNSPSLTPTVTPTPKPSLTPTPVPSTPPTPTVCVSPNKVTNVKVTCSNCFSSITPTPTVEAAQ